MGRTPINRVAVKPTQTEEDRAEDAIRKFKRRYAETTYRSADDVAVAIAYLERSTERVLRPLYGLPPTEEEERAEQLGLLFGAHGMTVAERGTLEP